MSLLKKLKHNGKGSYTVEACIVVTIVLLVMSAVVFSFILLSQKAMLTATAAHCAQKGAEIWMENGLQNGYGASLYYRITRFKEASRTDIEIPGGIVDELESAAAAVSASEGTERKINRIRYEALSRLNRCIMKPERTSIEIDYRSCFIKSRVQVTITQEIRNPLGFTKIVSGGKAMLTLKAVGTAAVAEPAEYIRNVDLALEYGKRLAGKLNSTIEGIRSRESGE